MTNMSQEEMRARLELVERLEAWPKERDAVAAKRDALIHEARAQGMSKTEIAGRMDTNRGTVISVLGDESED